jgi:hypothetical protein
LISPDRPLPCALPGLPREIKDWALRVVVKSAISRGEGGCGSGKPGRHFI